MVNRIAVLMTCYNRVQTTLACLDALFEAELPSEFEIEVFLVDDYSPDDTGKFVKEKYSQINVIQGNGNMFWAGGMRLAWEKAILQGKFGYFLWLNDDTVLYKNAILELIEVNLCFELNYRINITYGFCCSPTNPAVTTYGALFNRTSLKPNGSIQIGNLINGNLVLVPYKAFAKIGLLSNKYTHGIADYEYSLRAHIEGVDCVSTRIFVAECERNIDYFADKSKSVFNRMSRIYNDIFDKSDKIYFSEFLFFRKTHFNESKYITIIKYAISKVCQIIKNL